jgi:hypothetical protein
MRVPILGGVAAMVVQGYFRSGSKVISDVYFTHISSGTWWCERVTGGGPSELPAAGDRVPLSLPSDLT